MVKNLIVAFRDFAKESKIFSDKSCSQNQNTHLMFLTFFFLNSVVYEIMWKNIVEPDKSQMTIWRVLIECWVHVATNIH